jgi:Cu-processing system permease protein
LIWVASLVIAISTSARQLFAEKENRTIFPLLAKPVSRAQLLIGKFLGCWLACGLALFVFYLFLAIVSGARERTLDFHSYAIAMLLHWGALAVVVAMAQLGSIVFAAPSSNGTICFIVAAAVLLLERHLNTIAANTGGAVGHLLHAVYYMAPRLDWAFSVREFLVFHDPMPAFGIWIQALLFYAAYTALLVLAGWMRFRRKALNT